MSIESRKVECPLVRGAKAAAIDGLEADLAFCHPAILGLVSADVNTGIVELRTDLAEAEVENFDRMVKSVVERSVRSYRFAEATPPLWTHQAKGAYAGKPAVDSFVEKYSRPTGPGQHALVGAGAKLRKWLDTKIRSIGEPIDAEPWHLPNIEMADDLLHRTGYFSSHPQLVTFGYHLPPNFESIERFAASARGRTELTTEDFKDVEPTGFINQPAVCHNIFRGLRNEHVPNGRAVTAMGACYRYEGFRFKPLLRQWEFSMREVVVAGPPAWVEAEHMQLIGRAQALVVELDLSAELEIATDPFFVSQAASARAFQLMKSTKLEMRLRVHDQAVTAAASFNRHGRHFCEPMNVRIDGPEEFADSACSAFGLERWIGAFVGRWGADPAAWPSNFATAIQAAAP